MSCRSPSFWDIDYTIKAMSYKYPENTRFDWEWMDGSKTPRGSSILHAQRKTFTEANMCDEKTGTDIENMRNFLFSELRVEIENGGLSESLNSDDVQLVLEPKEDPVGVLYCYYFVNPRNRSLFWLDDWKGEEIFMHSLDILSQPRRGLAIQSQYWKHCQLFPDLCIVTEDLKNEIADMVIHAISDHLAWQRSPCPLNVEKLQNHLSLIDRISVESAQKRRHSAVVVGRIMAIFYRNYFFDCHGEECARVTSDQIDYSWKYRPSLLMIACAPLLFMAPVANVRLLYRTLNTRGTEMWNTCVNKLNSQLQDTNLLATVLLNANVGFLAIQSVDNGDGIPLKQLASYMSLVASLSSIILGLVFVQHTRTETGRAEFQLPDFFDRVLLGMHGFETYAFIYSLPYALLVWGMILFFVAFISELSGVGNVTSWVSVGSFVFVIGFLVTWSIWASRDAYADWWFQSEPEWPADRPLQNRPGTRVVNRSGRGRHLPTAHQEDDKSPRLGPLRRLTLPSWTRNRKGSVAESHAMQHTAEPQDVPSLSDRTPDEDSAASGPSVTVCHTRL
ncbi:hypothetical protein BU15DRAFT_83586 [Melanogaster broomeanus]|nr:hypothetical protein BU15DRAFT_83586 [Melanogaster broomeanus]